MAGLPPRTSIAAVFQEHLITSESGLVSFRGEGAASGMGCSGSSPCPKNSVLLWFTTAWLVETGEWRTPGRSLGKTDKERESLWEGPRGQEAIHGAQEGDIQPRIIVQAGGSFLSTSPPPSSCRGFSCLPGEGILPSVLQND